MNEARKLVEQAVPETPETAIVRACADCEQQHGVLDRSDARKSHGMCKRHFIENCRAAGLSEEEIEQELSGMPDSAFVPELVVSK